MGEGVVFVEICGRRQLVWSGVVSGIDFLGFSPFLESEIGGWEGVGLVFVR
jgi:hypothetical protein